MNTKMIAKTVGTVGLIMSLQDGVNAVSLGSNEAAMVNSQSAVGSESFAESEIMSTETQKTNLEESSQAGVELDHRLPSLPVHPRRVVATAGDGDAAQVELAKAFERKRADGLAHDVLELHTPPGTSLSAPAC